MSDSMQPFGPVVLTQAWNPDVVFSILAEPARRRTLLAMARGGAQPATILKSSAGKRLDATLKHLSALRQAGMVTTAPDPKDGRRTLYGLSPNMTIIRSGEGTALDFGCCVVRL